jgi:hypothetical protein
MLTNDQVLREILSKVDGLSDQGLISLQEKVETVASQRLSAQLSHKIEEQLTTKNPGKPIHVSVIEYRDHHNDEHISFNVAIGGLKAVGFTIEQNGRHRVVQSDLFELSDERISSEGISEALSVLDPEVIDSHYPSDWTPEEIVKFINDVVSCCLQHE